MKTRIHFALGTLALLAAAIAVSANHSAKAQETADQPVAQQQQNENLDLQGETRQLRPGETRQYGERDTVTGRRHLDSQRHKDAARRGDAGHKNAFKASELIGMNVRGHGGDDDIGSIDDLMISKDGRVIYAAVSFGGFLGIGDKLFAVPLEAIEFVKSEDENFARMNVTEQSLENKEGFNQDNWPHQANRDFIGGLETRQAERPETDSELQ